MKEFFKNNGSLIWRLILNQIGMTIFGLMTSMAAAAIDSSMATGDGTLRRTCMIWASLFAVIFYLCINYVAIKEEGQRDKIRADAGRIKLDPWRGLKIVLCASALNILFAVCIFVFGLLGAENGLAFEWAGGIAGSAKVLAAVLQAMYWGVLLGWSGAATIGTVPVIAFAVIPLPSILICSLAYMAGTHEFTIFGRMKSFFTPEGK